MNLHLSRARRSRLHVDVLAALGVVKDTPDGPEEAVKHAYAEVLAQLSEDSGWSPSEVFALSDAVGDRLAEVGAEYAVFDLPSLVEACGSASLARHAIRLNGAWPRPRGAVATDWTNAPADVADADVARVAFEPSFWQDHLKAWADEA